MFGANVFSVWMGVEYRRGRVLSVSCPSGDVPVRAWFARPCCESKDRRVLSALFDVR